MSACVKTHFKHTCLAFWKPSNKGFSLYISVSYRVRNHRFPFQCRYVCRNHCRHMCCRLFISKLTAEPSQDLLPFCSYCPWRSTRQSAKTGNADLQPEHKCKRSTSFKRCFSYSSSVCFVSFPIITIQTTASKIAMQKIEKMTENEI